MFLCFCCCVTVDGFVVPVLSSRCCSLQQQHNNYYFQSQAAAAAFSKCGASASDDDYGGDESIDGVTTTKQQPTLALLTFDLDDTLFPCQTVVDDANKAMIGAFHDAGYLEARNEHILYHTRSVRKKKKTQLTYSDLRKRAIRIELEVLSKKGAAINYDLVDTIFDAWLNERQASAGRNLFDGTAETLQLLKQKHPGVCIGAITNGRGNPLEMKNHQIATLFDFCVSGEDDGVFPERKPNRGIYTASLSAYYDQSENDNNKIDSHENIWCHVGDCLGNDVGASAKCGAYAVWAELDELKKSENQQPLYSTASPSQIKSRKKLADASRKHVSERITSLQELPDAVESILEKAAAVVPSKQKERRGRRGGGFGK